MSGGATASFVYDADGRRVKGTVNGVTTVYVGNHYEKQGSTIRKYYYAGGQRIAMREGSTLYYLLTDHLGSTAVTANASGGKHGELRYKPYAETRSTWGTTPTTYRFTGQREESTIGLYFYNARWYDAALGRFTQPDTLVPEPGNPQALNRYAYVLNNPIRYNDPSGHCPWCVVIGKVLLQTAVDVGIDYLIARATGTEFNLVDSLKVNAALNVTTLGVGSTVAKLRHLGKLTTLASHADEAVDAAKAVSKVEDVRHATTSAEVVQSILKGIDPRFFNPER